MARSSRPFNPFYAVLLVIGVAFTITACAYAVMMLRATRPAPAASSTASMLHEEAGLMNLLDERGMEILAVELLLLAIATIGAIALDQFRSSQVVNSVRPEPGANRTDHQ